MAAMKLLNSSNYLFNLKKYLDYKSWIFFFHEKGLERIKNEKEEKRREKRKKGGKKVVD